jgi:hypothetical protein
MLPTPIVEVVAAQAQLVVMRHQDKVVMVVMEQRQALRELL